MERRFARVSREAIARGRELRRKATTPEQLLWRKLRGRRLEGLRFRRQHPIGPYVVDFHCASAAVVVEVDGPIHCEPDERERDRRRQAYIEAQGLRLVRFSNAEVVGNLAMVLEKIRKACEG